MAAANQGCFEGSEFYRWKLIAQGYARIWDDGSYHQGPGATGRIIINGGIFVTDDPVELVPRDLYRFSPFPFNDPRSVASNWWITKGIATEVVKFARDYKVGVDFAARKLLVVPELWNSCEYLVCAELSRPMTAWTGTPKPADPSNAHRWSLTGEAALEAGVYVPPIGSYVTQFFLPGEKPLMASVFRGVMNVPTS